MKIVNTIMLRNVILISVIIVGNCFAAATEDCSNGTDTNVRDNDTSDLQNIQGYDFVNESSGATNSTSKKKLKACFRRSNPRTLSRIIYDDIEHSNESLDCGPGYIWGPERRLGLKLRDVVAVESGWYTLPDNYGTFFNTSRFDSFYIGNNDVLRGVIRELPTYIDQIKLWTMNVRRLEKGVLRNNFTRTLEISEAKNLIEIAEGAIEMPILEQLICQFTRVRDTKFISTLSKHLKTLHLRSNEFTIIRNKTFQNLQNLTSIRLKQNKIEIIERGAFDDLDNLNDLDLSYNCIKSLETGIFVGLESLTRVDLENNKLTIIERETFDLPRLEMLILYHTQLETIEEGAIKFYGNHECLIDISGTPLCYKPHYDSSKVCDKQECWKYSANETVNSRSI